MQQSGAISVRARKAQAKEFLESMRILTFSTFRCRALGALVSLESQGLDADPQKREYAQELITNGVILFKKKLKKINDTPVRREEINQYDLDRLIERARALRVYN